MADMAETDYVIVGAGSAGCVIAARLSEDPGTKVVLLEAGPRDTNPWIHIPLGYGKTIDDKRVNWCYETEPDLNGRRFFWQRGKVLGGSSSINGLVYIRGQAEDFDHWRQLGNAVILFRRTARMGSCQPVRRPARGVPRTVRDSGGSRDHAPITLPRVVGNQSRQPDAAALTSLGAPRALLKLLGQGS